MEKECYANQCSSIEESLRSEDYAPSRLQVNTGMKDISWGRVEHCEVPGRQGFCRGVCKSTGVFVFFSFPSWGTF